MSKRVMVVDDDSLVREMLAEQLEEDGFEVTQAASGGEALEIFEAANPRVMILDINMPDIDGIEVLEKLNLISRVNLDVIMLTGEGTVARANRALGMGALDFQFKPVDPEIMSVAVGKAFEHQDMLRKLVLTREKVRRLDKLYTLGLLSSGVADELIVHVQNTKNETRNIQAVLAELRVEDEDLDEYFAAIFAALSRQEKIIQGVKEFSQTSFHASRLVPMDMRQVFEGDFLTANPASGISAIQLDLVLPDLSLNVEACLPQLKLLSDHIITNAVAAIQVFPPEKGGVIKIRAFAEGAMAFIEWENNGPVIPPATITSIFNPFFTTFDVDRGPGLGLSICHGIAKNHQGDLIVVSDSQKTIFKFSIPLVKDR